MRSPCHFITEFVLLIKTPPFYEVNPFLIENGLHMEEFQNNFFQTTFHHHFQAKNDIFVTYSILTGDTKVEFRVCHILGVKIKNQSKEKKILQFRKRSFQSLQLVNNYFKFTQSYSGFLYRSTYTLTYYLYKSIFFNVSI